MLREKEELWFFKISEAILKAIFYWNNWNLQTELEVFRKKLEISDIKTLKDKLNWLFINFQECKNFEFNLEKGNIINILSTKDWISLFVFDDSDFPLENILKIKYSEWNKEKEVWYYINIKEEKSAFIPVIKAFYFDK